MNKLILSRQRLAPQDLISISKHYYEVSIDSAIIDKLKSSWKECKENRHPIVPYEQAEKQQTEKQQGLIGNSLAEDSLAEESARAGIFALLATLVQGKANIRYEFIELLVILLNKRIQPKIYGESDKEMIKCLLNFMRSPNENFTSICLTAREINVLLSSYSFSTGTAFSSAFTLSKFLDTADVAASFTCEALQTSCDTEGWDVHRPHKGCMTSANQIRALLEGSRNIDDSKQESNNEEDPIKESPQYNGPARDTVDASLKNLTVEFNAALTSGNEKWSQIPLSSHVLNLLNSTILVCLGSYRRVVKLNTSNQKDLLFNTCFDQISLVHKEVNSISVDDPLFVICNKFLTATNSLIKIISFELLYSLQALGTREKVVIEASEKQLFAAEERRLAMEAKNGPSDKKLKDNKKDKKPKGLVLGNGVKTVRNFILSSNENLFPISSQEFVTKSWKIIQDKINPEHFGNGIESFSDFLTPILLASQAKGKPKIPKGTRDTLPEQMMIRENAFQKILKVFRKHGAVGIDTPVFELRETLTGKYGEDSKLIYDLSDQGGELLSLRYDLTVPFARFLAMSDNTQIKRYHIAKVYRRDNPAMNRGRFREFHQCDFDIAGVYGPMIPDADVLKVVTEILDDLQIGEYIVKLNHRRLLDAMMEVCGVPPVKFRTICSAIDKLDKDSWEDVRNEMVLLKGLDGEVADKIGEFVRSDSQFVKIKSDPSAVLALLRAVPNLSVHPQAIIAFGELELLFKYLKALNCIKRIHFDMSLARGLDYYTGVIYEAMLTETDRVGSIAAGGRYDGLVGRFSGTDVPAVGVSVGIERILTIMEEQERARGNVRATTTQVIVCSVGSDLLETRMSYCDLLWQAGIAAEFIYKENPKIPAQLSYADENKIPLAIIFGSDELNKGVVKVKDLLLKQEDEVAKIELIAYLKNKITSLGY